MSTKKQLHIGAFLQGVGHTIAWRHPDHAKFTEFETYVRFAQAAERGKLDFIFFGEGLVVRERRLNHLQRVGWLVAQYVPRAINIAGLTLAEIRLDSILAKRLVDQLLGHIRGQCRHQRHAFRQGRHS